MTTTSRVTVKALIKSWNESQNAAIPRNELRKLAAATGLAMEDYIEHMFAQGEPTDGYDRDEFPMRAYAEYLLSMGYTGQLMRDPHDAERWIRAMAKGRTDEHDLNEEGARFWKAIRSKFGLWQTDKEMKETEGEKQ
jgi:hypothetical protein